MNKKLTFKNGARILLAFVLFLVLSVNVFAAYPATPYAPGDTLDPSCSPGDSNCTVDATTQGYFTATTTTASTFPYASTTALTVSGTNGLSLGSLNGPLQANNGAVSATTSVGVLYGGTGLTTAPSYGQVLLG